MPTLFASQAPRPLADRLRPESLDEVLGQQHLLGPDGPIGRMAGSGRLASFILWGPPGTGKTFASAAIAQALGKKVLVTDMSRIQSMWVGESEKNVRRLFNIFERIVRRTDNPPVLLLNEAEKRC